MLVRYDNGALFKMAAEHSRARVRIGTEQTHFVVMRRVESSQCMLNKECECSIVLCACEGHSVYSQKQTNI